MIYALSGKEMENIIEKIKSIITDSIKFWEIGRLIYNTILALIVIGFFIVGIMQGKKLDYLNISLGLFVLAIVANILYCSAYFIDIFIQLSAFQEFWKKYRWALLVLGILLASLFTCFVSHEIFIPKSWED